MQRSRSDPSPAPARSSRPPTPPPPRHAERAASPARSPRPTHQRRGGRKWRAKSKRGHVAPPAPAANGLAAAPPRAVLTPAAEAPPAATSPFAVPCTTPLGPQLLSPFAPHRQACATSCVAGPTVAAAAPAAVSPFAAQAFAAPWGAGHPHSRPRQPPPKAKAPSRRRARYSCRLSKCWGPSRWCPCGRVLASLTLASKASASPGPAARAAVLSRFLHCLGALGPACGALAFGLCVPADVRGLVFLLTWPLRFSRAAGVLASGLCTPCRILGCTFALVKNLCTAEGSLFGAVDSGHASEAARRAGSLSLCTVCIKKAKRFAIRLRHNMSQRGRRSASPRRREDRFPGPGAATPPAPAPSTPCTPTVLLTSATFAGTAPDITAISRHRCLQVLSPPLSGGEEQVCKCAPYVLKRWTHKALERPPSSHSPHVRRTFSTRVALRNCVLRLRQRLTCCARFAAGASAAVAPPRVGRIVTTPF